MDKTIIKAANVSNVSKATKLATTGIVGIIIQVVLGLIAVLLIHWVSLFAVRADSLLQNSKSNPNAQVKVAVLSGYAESSQLSSKSYNTILPYANNYMGITPSSNIKGGAQFTYSFWISVGHPDSAIGKPIFLRGDSKQTYTYNMANKNVTDYVAMCPLFEFGSNPMEFNVRFNTIHNINEILQITKSTSTNNMYRKNMLSLLANQWFLITIMFEDNIPINDFENGLSIKFYINQVLYESGTWATMLKQNTGNLFFFPSGSVSQCKISNFDYYNHTLSMADISAKFRAGPSQQPIASVTKSMTSPLVLSDYNTMDIYNT